MKLKRKAYLSTLITLVMAISISMLIFAYLEYSAANKEGVLLFNGGNKMRYIEDDLISNLYGDLLDIELYNISSSPSYKEVYFTRAGKLSETIDHNTIMTDYSNFVSGAYSNLIKADILISNLQPTFFIRPYNSTFTLNGKELVIFNDQYNDLQDIYITMKLSENIASLNKNKSPNPDPVGPVIHVTFIDNAGNILQNSSVQLDPSQKNKKFEVGFQGGSKAEVKFGNEKGFFGTLVGKIKILSANVTGLRIRYNPYASPIIIDSASNIYINLTPYNISKTHQIILAEE